MIPAAFLLDAGNVVVDAKHVRDHWLPRLDELDERELEAAAGMLDRSAYVAEQAARRIRSHLRGLCVIGRGAPMASGSDACDACIDEAEELAEAEHARGSDGTVSPA
jgi:hypothetical protein